MVTSYHSDEDLTYLERLGVVHRLLFVVVRSTRHEEVFSRTRQTQFMVVLRDFADWLGLLLGQCLLSILLGQQNTLKFLFRLTLSF